MWFSQRKEGKDIFRKLGGHWMEHIEEKLVFFLMDSSVHKKDFCGKAGWFTWWKRATEESLKKSRGM